MKFNSTKIHEVFLIVFILFGCNSDITKKVEENYSKSELEVQHGMELFNSYCANCHNFMGNQIGPNLSGITSKVTKEWLLSFINHPKAMIDLKDDRASMLFEKYKIYMPSFTNIKGKDLEDLLGFVHKFSEAEKKNKSNRKGGLIDPIKEKIIPSGYSLVVKEWLTIPPSSKEFPRTRINKLETIKSKSKERYFVSDLRGKLYEIINDRTSVFMDFNQLEENFISIPGFGTGLGSFAFHPNFDKNGRLYTTHTETSKTKKADFPIPDNIPAKLQWVLSEWETKSPSVSVFSGTKRELLRIDMVTQIHGLQEIAFNPLAKSGDLDFGILYIGVGDGGSGLAGYSYLCDNPNFIWGSVLRINPEKGNSKNGQYSIPKDNPFIMKKEGLSEVWLRGFRNPHRFSWDQNGSNKMFITNIGEHSIEEVNLAQKGGHYGWPHREGNFLFDTNANTELVYPIDTDKLEFIPPVLQYDHDEGNAVSGGYVYASDLIPDLNGKYIFGDIPRGSLFFANVDEIEQGKQTTIHGLGLKFKGEEISLKEMNHDLRVDLRFGTNHDGEVCLFTKSNGTIYRIVGFEKNSFSK